MSISILKKLQKSAELLIVLVAVLSVGVLFSPSAVLAAPSCDIPNTGIWEINSDCDLNQSSVAPGNVRVQSGATLRIPNNSSLGIDFSDSHLRIVKDAKVLIEQGGKIRTAVNTGINPGSGGDSSFEGFPPLPSYIQLSSNESLEVDFSAVNEAGFRLTIPTRFLPLLPQDADGEIIFPDNFCALRVTKPSRFLWLDEQGNIVDDELFTSIPEDSSVQEVFETDYFDGIAFSGPIGSCAGGQTPWHFPAPLSQTDEGMTAPERNLHLVIEIVSLDASIEFLAGEVGSGSISLDSFELFSGEVFSKFKDIVDDYVFNDLDSGYIGVLEFLQRICDEVEGTPNEVKCLIGRNG